MRLSDDHRDQLVEAVREAYRNDWSRWELPEVVHAVARSLQIRLTRGEASEIIKEAVPHAR